MSEYLDTLKSVHLHFLHRNLAYTAVWISVSKPHKVFFENMFQHCVVTVDEIWCIELYLNSLHVPQQTQKVSRKIFFIHLFCICTKEKYNNRCKNNNVKYMDSHHFQKNSSGLGFRQLKQSIFDKAKKHLWESRIFTQTVRFLITIFQKIYCQIAFTNLGLKCDFWFYHFKFQIEFPVFQTFLY